MPFCDPRFAADVRGRQMMIRQNFNRRHSPNRRRTRVDAMIDSLGARLPAVILDVSFEGMSLSLPHNLAPGTPITIEVLNQNIPAIVHWSRSRLAGVHLLERLEGQTLIALENADDEWADYR